jgi:peptidoglycan hydrolase CwlO-like protein
MIVDKLKIPLFRTPVQLFISLVAILLIFAVGCDKSKKKDKAEVDPRQEWADDMRGRVNDNIADTDKKKKVLALVDEMERDLHELDRHVQKVESKFFEVDSNYNATDEDLRGVFEQVNILRKDYRERFMNARFEMRDLVTPDEWEELTDAKKSKTLYMEWQRYPGE